MAIMDVQVAPIGTGDSSMHEVVARCVKAARDGDVKVQVTPMGTVMEGPLPQLFQVVATMHRQVLDGGAPRVITNIRVDERSSGEVGLERRVREVEEMVGETR